MTNTTTHTSNQTAQAMRPTSIVYTPSSSARVTHKATGIFWFVSTDNHPTAPYGLHIYERGGKMPLASKRYKTQADRAARVTDYIMRCMAKGAAAQSHKPTPSDVLMPKATPQKSPRVNRRKPSRAKQAFAKRIG